MNVRQTLVGFLGGLTLAFATERAVGYPITWEFAGEITSVFDLDELLGGAVSVGTPFSGYFTFDPNTLDSEPKVITVGLYEGTVHDVFGQLGPFDFDGPVGTGNNILVLDDFPAPDLDSYSIRSGIVLNGEVLRFSLVLKDLSATVLSTDTLLLIPPPLELFDSAAFRIVAESEVFDVPGTVTRVVPEPGTLVLLALGLILRERLRLCREAIL